MTEPASTEGRDEKSRASTMRSLDRAMDLLDALARHQGPMRLADLARATGLHRATALRILTTLHQRDYVSSDGTGYRMGVAFLPGAHAFLVSDTISKAAQPVLQELAAITGLTASYHVRSGLDRIVVARVEGTDPLRYQLPIGQRLPLFLGGGKIIAAWMDADERRRLVDAVSPMRNAQGREITPAELMEELDATRRRGYTITVDERAIGTAGASVPVLGRGDTLLGVVTLSGPSEKNSADAVEHWVPELRRAATALAAAHARST